MNTLTNMAVRVVVTLLCVIIGLLIANGLLWIFVEVFGPFYPGSDQQQRNFNYYLLGSLIVIVVSGVFGNLAFSRYRRRRLQ